MEPFSDWSWVAVTYTIFSFYMMIVLQILGMVCIIITLKQPSQTPKMRSQHNFVNKTLISQYSYSVASTDEKRLMRRSSKCFT